MTKHMHELSGSETLSSKNGKYIQPPYRKTTGCVTVSATLTRACTHMTWGPQSCTCAGQPPIMPAGMPVPCHPEWKKRILLEEEEEEEEKEEDDDDDDDDDCICSSQLG